MYVSEIEPRRRILEVAGRAFKAHGYRAVSMSRLAGSLGMSKRTIYEHFPGKESLLEAVLDDYLTGMEQDVAAVVADDSGPFEERLERVGVTIARHLQGLDRSVMEEVERLAPRVADSMHRRRLAASERLLGRLIEQGQKEGALRDDMPPAFAAKMLAVANDGLARAEVLEELQLTAADLPPLILRALLYGLLRRDPEHGR